VEWWTHLTQALMNIVEHVYYVMSHRKNLMQRVEGGTGEMNKYSVVTTEITST